MKKFILIIISLLFLSGCTRTMHGANIKAVQECGVGNVERVYADLIDFKYICKDYSKYATNE